METDPNFFSGLFDGIPNAIWSLLAISGIAGWISAFLSSKHKNTFVQLIADTLNVIGANVFKAKNADDDR